MVDTDADVKRPDLLTLPDGRQAQYWEGGVVDGRPVVFFHGCPDTRHVAFSGADAAVEAGVRLVAANRPGYGESSPHESSLSSVADDACDVADLLGIDRFTVLGMSIGGVYALATAARRPDRVVAAGVMATPGPITRMAPQAHRDDLPTDEVATLLRLSAAPVDAALEHFRPGFRDWSATIRPDDPDDSALASRWLAGLPEPDAGLVRRMSAAETAASVREALADPCGYLRDAALAFRDWEFDLAAVQCPVRLWYGDLDTNAPVRSGRWLAAALPDASLVVRRQTTHLATLLAHWDDVLSWCAGH